MTNVDHAKLGLQKFMNKREYETLVLPLLRALDAEYNFKKKIEFKSFIERVFNDVTNKVNLKSITLENGEQTITIEDLIQSMTEVKMNSF